MVLMLESNKYQTINKVDGIDTRILGLILEGKSNKEINVACEIPLFTVKRRVRNLISSDLVQYDYKLNYERLGFKSGLVYINLRNGDIDEIAKEVYDLDGITSVEIHIGKTDILACVIYRESKDLLKLMAEIKNMKSVGRVSVSERIYQNPNKKEIIKSIVNKSRNDQNKHTW